MTLPRTPLASKFKRVIRHPLADGEQDPWSWRDEDGGVGFVGNEEEEFMADGPLVLDLELTVDEEVAHEPKDCITTTRWLVEACGGQELLKVRRQLQTPAFDPEYTRKVEIFKADMNAGRWVPVVAGGGDPLSQSGEALFLSRSFSKSTNVYGDLEEGLVYFVDADQVFDTRTWACMLYSLPWQTKRADTHLLRGFSLPKLVL